MTANVDPMLKTDFKYRPIYKQVQSTTNNADLAWHRVPGRKSRPPSQSDSSSDSDKVEKVSKISKKGMDKIGKAFLAKINEKLN